MKKFLLRVTLILITFPLIFALIFLLPHCHFLALAIAMVILTFIGALEVNNLFEKRSIPTFHFIPPILGATLPLASYLVVAGVAASDFTFKWLAVIITIVLLLGIGVPKNEELKKFLHKISSSLIIIIYPGLFLSIIVLMTSWKHASYKLLFFFCLIFANDIIAYTAGNLFGKKRNLFISPNKSITGFISGFVSSIVVSILFYYLLPWMFHTSLPLIVLLGAGIGLTTILGDLVESALKRSAEVKDSGTFMIGRGGILDSLDSMLISAPFFYVFSHYVLQ